ncbi:MAG TPA: YjgN family protein [Burkholderiales bacterium]
MERTAAAAPAPAALQFAGSAGEYFRIWIVNLCLTVVTLGLYSPWAKVRRKRYFYGCTRFEGSAFEYTGNPVAILKGRLIVLAIFALYSLSQQVLPLLSFALLAAIFALLPWIIQRALQFNARNSLHRNVRFGFHGGKLQILAVLLIAALLIPVTLGIAYPWYLAMKRRLFVENSSYGRERFAFSAGTGDYYVASVKLSFAFLAFLAGSIATLGIGLLPFYLLLRAYAEVAFARLAWRGTTLAARSGAIRFDCGWTTGGLAGLYFVNALGVLFSLGLLIPWAAVRSARYKLERITLLSEHGPAKVLAAVEENVGAVGDEAGELLGFDFGL